MNYTILSAKQSELLENLIVKYGRIVTTVNIISETRFYLGYQETKNLISQLTKKGWLIRIKRGLYAISDLSSRGFLSLSPYIVANLLVKNSYVSFESALQYHGLFDQATDTFISVSKQAYKDEVLQNITYSYVKTQEKYYFGWEEQTVDQGTARIATVEKAIIDMVNFHKNTYTIDLVIEKIKQYKDSINFDLLAKNLKGFSNTSIAIFGFILDLSGINSDKLYKLVRNNKGVTHMLKNSTRFNAKWRLYYDEYFNKYK